MNNHRLLLHTPPECHALSLCCGQLPASAVTDEGPQSRALWCRGCLSGQASRREERKSRPLLWPLPLRAEGTAGWTGGGVWAPHLVSRIVYRIVHQHPHIVYIAGSFRGVLNFVNTIIRFKTCIHQNGRLYFSYS